MICDNLILGLIKIMGLILLGGAQPVIPPNLYVIVNVIVYEHNININSPESPGKDCS